MRMREKMKELTLDVEWVQLIKKAIRLGLTPEEVREFLMRQQCNS